jgi:hypothetical protein
MVPGSRGPGGGSAREVGHLGGGEHLAADRLESATRASLSLVIGMAPSVHLPAVFGLPDSGLAQRARENLLAGR